MIFEELDPLTPLYGTQLALTYSEQGKLVEFLKSMTRTALTTGSIVEAHNTYALYITTLLMCATSHRPVTDPFARRRHLSPESNLVLISDKVITSRHEWRMSVFPTLAGEALAEYESHLTGLASRLLNDGFTTLGSAVSELINDKVSSNEIPFLFLLNEDLKHTRSITETELENYIKKALPVPPNVFRHAFSVWATINGIDANLIEIQLGHISSLSHPFGSSEELSPEHFRKELEPKLDSWLRGLGWEAVPGLKYKKASHRNLNGHKFGVAATVHENSALGPELRRLEREKNVEKDKKIVQQAIYETFGPEVDRKITGEEVNAVQKRIVELSIKTPEKAKRRLRLLWRHWLRLRRRGVDVEMSSRIVPLTIEESPFKEKTLGDYERATAMRMAFKQYLGRRGKTGDKPQKIERVAEIVISAALFGYMANKRQLEKLRTSLENGVHIINDQCVVAIGMDDENKYKPSGSWVSDPMTRGLLLGLLNGGAMKEPCPSEKKLLHAIEVIFFELQGSRLKPDSMYDTLVQLSESLALIELPPILREVVTDRVRYQPLPMTTVERLITSKRISGLAMPDSDSRDRERSLLDSPSGLSDKSGTLLKQFLRKLKKEISLIENLPAIGNQRKSSVPRQMLKRAVISLVKKQREPLPPIGLAIASWVVELCTNGTFSESSQSGKKDLRFSTIAKYVRRIIVGLPEVTAQIDFFNLNETEYEEIYLRALDYTAATYRSYTARRIRQFHRFLVAAIDIDEPDWGVVVGPDSSANVDANILSYKEYQRFLRLIEESKEIGDLTKDHCITLLVLGYRFGLRIGEALRLQPKDIQCLDDGAWMIVLVHNNVFGVTKSQAGVRQIPLTHKLLECEWMALSRLLSKSRSRLVEDRQAGLFSETSDARRQISRTYVTRIIHTVLRQVTGDSGFRYHHLRHTFANDIYQQYMKARNASFCELPEALSLSTGEIVTMDGIPPAYTSLQDISRAIGHARIATTFQSYIHLAEWQVALNYCRDALSTVTDSAVSYALQASTSYPRVTRRRLSLSTKDSWKLLVLAPVYEKNSTWELVSAKLVRHPSREKVHLGHTLKTDEISFVEIDRMLVNASRRSDSSDDFTESRLIARVSCNDILRCASEIEESMGVAVYGLPSARTTWWNSDESASTRLNAETVRVRGILNEWWLLYKNSNEHEKELVHDGIRTATNMLKNGVGSMLARGKCDLDKLFSGLRILNVNSTEFVAIIPDDIPKQRADEIQKIIAPYSFAEIEIRKIYTPHNAAHNNKEQRVGIRPSRHEALSKIYSEKAFRRLIVAVYSGINCQKD